MRKQRWRLGSYLFEYNPKSFDTGLSATERESISVTGMVSNPNLLFDKSIDLTLDLYDKPTYYANSQFFANSYISMAEDNSNGYLYCLRSGAIDIRDLSGGIVRTITISFVGAPVAVAKANDKIVLLMKESSSQSSLYVTDDFGIQNSKYTITDVDYLGIVNICWQSSTNYIFCLNKYGKIFRIDYTSGASLLLKQFDDFDSNLASNNAVYNSIHFYNGFIGYTKGKMLSYLNSTYQIIYGNELPQNANIGTVIDVALLTYNGTFHLLTSSGKVYKFYPNVCGVDIEIIKNQIAGGIVQLLDDKSQVLNVIISSMDTRRLRNKQDARYEVNLSGIILN